MKSADYSCGPTRPKPGKTELVSPVTDTNTSYVVRTLGACPRSRRGPMHLRRYSCARTPLAYEAAMRRSRANGSEKPQVTAVA
jgi:hypothetical protein